MSRRSGFHPERTSFRIISLLAPGVISKVSLRAEPCHSKIHTFCSSRLTFKHILRALLPVESRGKISDAVGWDASEAWKWDTVPFVASILVEMGPVW